MLGDSSFFDLVFASWDSGDSWGKISESKAVEDNRSPRCFAVGEASGFGDQDEGASGFEKDFVLIGEEGLGTGFPDIVG
jgi:hypothetical protein